MPSSSSPFVLLGRVTAGGLRSEGGLGRANQTLISCRTRMNYPPLVWTCMISCPALYQCPSPLCDGGEAHGRCPGDAP
eukprot:3165864-Prymnesium_polylepis.1